MCANTMLMHDMIAVANCLVCNEYGVQRKTKRWSVSSWFMFFCLF